MKEVRLVSAEIEHLKLAINKKVKLILLEDWRDVKNLYAVFIAMFIE
jgi:hypothetical protein